MTTNWSWAVPTSGRADPASPVHSNGSANGFQTSAPVFIPCDNPRNWVSPDLAWAVDVAAYVAVLPLMVVYGVVTNLFAMVVFARQGLSDRINMCLFSLAVTDAGFLLTLMATKSFALLLLVDRDVGGFWRSDSNGGVLGSSLGLFIASNIVTAIVALDRCLAVVWPLRARDTFKTRNLAVVIVVAVVYAVAVKTVALALKYVTVKVKDEASNATTYVSRLTPFYVTHRDVIDVIYSDIASLALPTVSLVVVVVCTVTIVVRLKRTADWRRHTASNMTSSEKREAALTRMLVTVCLVYVICNIPSVARTFALHRFPEFLTSGYLCNTFKITTALVNTLEALNCSINFAIYYRQGSRFRRTFRNLWCRAARNALTREWSTSQNLNFVAATSFYDKPRNDCYAVNNTEHCYHI